jgi:acetyl-CoA C-acetyltransferase
MVYILGGWQSDFARNWAREDVGIGDAFVEGVRSALDAADLEAAELDTGHVGNFVGDLFAGQGLLGGFFAYADPALDGLPTSRHEAACASGSVAALAAAAEIEAGRYGLSCVVGIEMMRNVPGRQAADHLGAASHRGHEFSDAAFLWPRAFSDLADEYDRRWGLDYAHLGRIADINFSNARRNPNAQTRAWQFSEGSFTEDSDLNPVVEGRTRKNDCGQITDGVAVLFLASEERAREYASRRNIPMDRLARISGWGHRSSPIGMREKLRLSEGSDFVFPQVKRAIDDARHRAGVASIGDIDAVETHDCFAMTEYMAIDHLGITAPGEAWKAVEAGDIELGGRIPVNPSGGLIGLGHPVGATGVRMVLDAARQVTGQAGDCQVEGARRAQTLNIGGSTTTTVSFVVERAA